MGTIVINSLKTKWKFYINTFLSLFIASNLLATFSLLLINSIYAKSLGAASGLKNPVLPIAAFGSLIGLSFFLGILLLISSINLSIRLRWKDLILLRVIGATHNKIKKIIFLENLVMVFFTTILALFCAIPLSKLIITYLQNNSVLESNFHLYTNFGYQWVFVISTILTVVTIVFFASLKIKTIDVKKMNEFYVKKNIFATIIKIILGLTSIAGAIALTVIPNLMINKGKDGGLGSGMIMCSIICYFIAFAFLGRYLILIILKLLEILFPNYLFKSVIKSFIYNISKIYFPISLIIVLILFTNYATTTVNLDPKINNNNKVLLFLLTVIVIVFNGMIAANTLIQYFVERKKNYQELRVIGFKRSLIFYHNLLEILLITFISFLFSLTINFYYNLQYCRFNNINFLSATNNMLFWLINSIIFVAIVGVSLIPLVFNKRKSKISAKIN